MSVNGITGTGEAYSNYSSTAAKGAKTETKTKAALESASAVYEPSEEAKVASTKKYTPDTNTIAKMKLDAQERTSQLQSLVEKIIMKQGQTAGQANDIWSVLAGGKFEVDPATKTQAQADIAEDGYWGVNQTSKRILDFATALTGGDPSKIEEMRAAFKKGYEKAEKIWGGSLPEISKKTYDAVLQGFDQMKQDADQAALS